MARSCTVCTHPKSVELNGLLLAKTPITQALAQNYGLSTGALERHRRNHLAAARALASSLDDDRNRITVVGMANDLYEKATALFAKAEAKVDEGGYRGMTAAATALRELRASIELLAKLVVDDVAPEHDVHNSWLDEMILAQIETTLLPELPSGAPVIDPEVAEAEVVV